MEELPGNYLLAALRIGEAYHRILVWTNGEFVMISANVVVARLGPYAGVAVSAFVEAYVDLLRVRIDHGRNSPGRLLVVDARTGASALTELHSVAMKPDRSTLRLDTTDASIETRDLTFGPEQFRAELERALLSMLMPGRGQAWSTRLADHAGELLSVVVDGTQILRLSLAGDQLTTTTDERFFSLIQVIAPNQNWGEWRHLAGLVRAWLAEEDAAPQRLEIEYVARQVATVGQVSPAATVLFMGLPWCRAGHDDAERIVLRALTALWDNATTTPPTSRTGTEMS